MKASSESKYPSGYPAYSLLDAHFLSETAPRILKRDLGYPSCEIASKYRGSKWESLVSRYSLCSSLS